MKYTISFLLSLIAGFWAGGASANISVGFFVFFISLFICWGVSFAWDLAGIGAKGLFKAKEWLEEQEKERGSPKVVRKSRTRSTRYCIHCGQELLMRKETRGKIMKGAIVGIAIALAIGVAGAYLLLPKEQGEQVIIDETASVYLDPKQYSRELEAGQVIHVYAKVDQYPADVYEAWPVVLSVKDPQGQVVFDSGDMFEWDGGYSFDFTITSSGAHTFEIESFGDYPAEVRIKVTITGSKELGPARFEVTSLALSSTEAKVGEEVTVSAKVKNIGEITGTYKATLTIDGVEIATREVTLLGGSSQTVSFTIVENTAGTHAIEVNGLHRSLTIKKNTTTLSISPSSFTREPDSSTILTATLTSDGTPLAGKTIAWSATRGAVSPTSGTTDSSGQISVTYIAPSYETTDSITARFAGDTQYLASSGNSSGSITTFMFFDDFLGTSVDTNKWTENKSASGIIAVNNGILTLKIPSGTNQYAFLNSNLTFSGPFAFEIRAKAYWQAGTYTAYRIGYVWKVEGTFLYTGFAAYYDYARYRILGYPGGPIFDASPNYLDVFHVFKGSFDGAQMRFWIDGIEQAESPKTGDPTPASVRLSVHHSDLPNRAAKLDVDWVKVYSI